LREERERELVEDNAKNLHLKSGMMGPAGAKGIANKNKPKYNIKKNSLAQLSVSTLNGE
jgi:hypothetical protein